MKPTITALEKQLIKFGLKPIDLAANATNQSRKFYDPKADVAYITFTNGHVARTVKGVSGKRISLNRTENKQRIMLKTEIARLNRVVKYLEVVKS